MCGNEANSAGRHLAAVVRNLDFALVTSGAKSTLKSKVIHGETFGTLT